MIPSPVDPPPGFDAALAAFTAVLAARRQRGLLVLEGTPEACRRHAAATWPPARDLPWISARMPASERRPADFIGRDLAGAVVDLHGDPPADALTAAAGAVRAGGVLVLLTPPLASWPEAVRGPSCRGLFALRAARLLQAEPGVMRVDLATGELCPPVLPETADPPADLPIDGGDPRAVTADQAEAIVALGRLVRGRPRRPLVLTADRGRGKSAALGIAAARALQAGTGPVLVTSPNAGNVAILLRHAAEVLDVPCTTPALAAAGLRQVPPDVLLREQPPARLLLVDEAAALPVPVLTALLEGWPRVAFATTVHGYEGSGRGFEIRFRDILDRRAPGWRPAHLRTPVRYAAGDPLEAAIFRLFCLDARPAEDAWTAEEARAEAHVLPADTLAVDEERLRQVFGLLVQAHYRTRPADLVRLLDDPCQELVATELGDRTVAAAVAQHEGGLDRELAAAMARGERRPQGHHGAGVLAAQLGLSAGASRRSLRIARIAVTAGLRRRGYGRALVAAVRQQAASRSASLVTTSFGATPELLAFWWRCGLRPVRIGLRRDAASGEHGALALAPLDDAGIELATAARWRFAADLPDQLADALADLEPRLVPWLLAELPLPHTGDAALATLDAEAAARWQQGRVALEEVVGAVRRGLLRHLALGPPEPEDATPALAGLTARVLQHRSWKEVARLLGASGRAEAESRLREVWATELGSRPGTPPSGAAGFSGADRPGS